MVGGGAVVGGGGRRYCTCSYTKIMNVGDIKKPFKTSYQ